MKKSTGWESVYYGWTIRRKSEVWCEGLIGVGGNIREEGRRGEGTGTKERRGTQRRG